MPMKGCFVMVGRESEQNPARRGPRRLDRWLGVGLGLSALLLLLGWLLPVMTVETFFVFDDRVTIAGALFTLLQEGERLLFGIVFLFTVIFPVAKLTLAYLAWHRLSRQRGSLGDTVGWIEQLGKWSMLDVFVVALLVVVLKLSIFSDVTVEAGLYIFAAAVVCSMLTVRRIVQLGREAGVS